MDVLELLLSAPGSKSAMAKAVTQTSTNLGIEFDNWYRVLGPL